MVNFDNAIRCRVAFPLIRLRNCLKQEFFNELLSEFPEEAETSNFDMVMGGRRRLSSDDPAFYAFIARRPAWKRFYNFVNSPEFVDKVRNVFKHDLQNMGSPLIEPNKYDENYLLRKAQRRQIPKWRRVLLRKVRHFASLIYASNDENKVEDQTEEHSEELFLHFDISAAYDGYTREIHRDLDNRFAALLIYFSDAEETGGVGGEFTIHELLANDDRGNYIRRPPPEETVVVSNIKPERNLLLMFLSTPNSYHSVPRISGAKAARKFIYVAITAKRGLHWPEAYTMS